MTSKLLNGIVELLNSASGVFSLISLMAISIIAWHSPNTMSVAFVAFFGIVPAALAMAEHREQMAQINQSNSLQTAIDAIKGKL